MEVVNEHAAPPQVVHTGDSSSNSANLLIAVAAIVLFAILIFALFLPSVRNLTTRGPQMNVPGQVDVNLNQK